MLTLQYVPYTQISALETEKRLDKLIDIVKQENIIIMEGRLKKGEETELIKRTMEAITPKFKGIEIATVYPESKEMNFLKKMFMNMLLGDRRGVTIIGPASIVKQIKKDPEKIQLLTIDKKIKKKKRK